MFKKINPLHFQSLENEMKQIAPFIKGETLNAGCGNRNIDITLKNCGATNVVNYDIESTISNAIIGSLGKTPFADGQFDCIFSNAVLEHVPDIHGVMAELVRILKSGGRMVLCIPFLQPFHPCPTDFRRYTKNGMKELAELHGLKVEGVYPVHSISQVIGWCLLSWGFDHGGWRGVVSKILCYIITRFNTKTDLKLMSTASAFQLVSMKS